MYVFNSNACLWVLLQCSTVEGGLKYPVNHPSMQLIQQVFIEYLLSAVFWHFQTLVLPDQSMVLTPQNCVLLTSPGVG